MSKHKFLSKVKSVDKQAYINLERISHIASLDKKYAERIRYAKTYSWIGSASDALVGLLKWSETLEGDEYWWGIWSKLVKNYK